VVAAGGAEKLLFGVVEAAVVEAVVEAVLAGEAAEVAVAVPAEEEPVEAAGAGAASPSFGLLLENQPILGRGSRERRPARCEECARSCGSKRWWSAGLKGSRSRRVRVLRKQHRVVAHTHSQYSQPPQSVS